MDSRLKIKPDAKILAVDLAYIGDLIMSTPAYANLRKAYPGATIDLLVAPSSRQIIEDNIFFNEILTATFKKSGWRAVKREAARIAERKYDLAISFHRAHGSLLMLMLARIPKRIGFSHGGRRFFLTSGVPFELNKHRAWNHLNLLHKCLDIEVDFMTPTSVGISPDTIEQARQILGKYSQTGPWAAINPNASWPTKKWTPDGFATVGDYLAGRGFKVVLIGGPGDKQSCAEIKTLMKSDSLDLSGETSLPELSAILKLCDLLVTNDSGPMHIGQAVGTKVIAIFGPTDPARCGPWLSKIEPVQLDIDCIRCYKKECSHMSCMKNLEKDRVIRVIEICISLG
ncbi:MAG: lipopolysaccharide heptosyltransferase II [bacterium]|nr:lipopolysaccharide heptosyltransferase II [bacterium]